MKTVWAFIIKYEFFVFGFIIIGLYVSEYKTSEMWMGELAFVVFLIATTRLAMHPMWKKDDEED